MDNDLQFIKPIFADSEFFVWQALIDVEPVLFSARRKLYPYDKDSKEDEKYGYVYQFKNTLAGFREAATDILTRINSNLKISVLDEHQYDGSALLHKNAAVILDIESMLSEEEHTDKRHNWLMSASTALYLMECYPVLMDKRKIGLPDTLLNNPILYIHDMDDIDVTRVEALGTDRMPILFFNFLQNCHVHLKSAYHADTDSFTIQYSIYIYNFDRIKSVVIDTNDEN